MRLNLILFFTILTNALSSQNISKIDYIKFSYENSVVLYSGIEITITKNNRDNHTFEVNYYENREKRTRTLIINDREFQSIIGNFNSIKNADISDNFSMGLDGAKTGIEVGSLLFNSIKYDLWGVDKSQLNTTLKDFILTAQSILKLGEIKVEDYN